MKKIHYLEQLYANNCEHKLQHMVYNKYIPYRFDRSKNTLHNILYQKKHNIGMGLIDKKNTGAKTNVTKTSFHLKRPNVRMLRFCVQRKSKKKTNVKDFFKINS